MGEIVVPETPNWLKALEEKRELRLKGKLGHEAGAGAPCLKCADKCPGLDLHFWRKSCKICRCPKEEHDVHDDDIYGWAQFQLLGSKPNKIKTKIVLPGKKDEVELEWAPKGNKDTIDKYLKTLPPEKLPVKGSKAAQDRKQLLQKQLPIHDIDPTLCHELNEDELKKMNDYIAHVKKSSVGVGQIVNLSGIIKGTLHNLGPQEASVVASRSWKALPTAEIVKLQAQNNASPLLSHTMQKLQIGDKQLPNLNPNVPYSVENVQNALSASKIKDINAQMYADEIRKPSIGSQYSKPFKSPESQYEIDENLLKGTNFNPKNTPSQFVPQNANYQNVNRSEPYGDLEPNFAGQIGSKPQNYNQNNEQYGFENPYFNDKNVPFDKLETLKNRNKHFPTYAPSSIGIHSENVQPQVPKNIKDLVYSTYDNFPNDREQNNDPRLQHFNPNVPYASDILQNNEVKGQIPGSLDYYGQEKGRNVPAHGNLNQDVHTPGNFGQNVPTPGNFGRNGPGTNNFGQNVHTPGNFGQNVPTPGNFGQNVPETGNFGQTVPPTDNFGQNVPTPDNFGRNVPGTNNFGQNVHTPGNFGQNVPTPGNFGQNVPETGNFGQNIPSTDNFGQNVPTPGNFDRNGPGTDNFGQNVHTPGNFGQNVPRPGNFGQNVATPGNFGGNVSETGNFGQNIPTYGNFGQNFPKPGNVGGNVPATGNVGQNDPTPGNFGKNVPTPGNFGQNVPTPVNFGGNVPATGNFVQNVPGTGNFGHNVPTPDNFGQNILQPDSNINFNPHDYTNVLTPQKKLSQLKPGEISLSEDVLEPSYVNIGAIKDISYPEIYSAMQGTNDFFEDFSPESIKEILNNVKLPDCHYCKKPFEENEFAVSIDRANVLFHADCFKCAGCNQSLADNVYFYHKETDNIYCGRDYAKIRGIPRCKACDELIFTKEYCLAENSTYHLKHFCCIECDSPLAGQDYTLEGGYPYCLPCFERSKAARCGTCQRVIKPDEQGCQLKDVHFHATETCFSCFMCSRPLLGQKLLLRHDRLFCSHDCLNTFKI